LCHSAFPACRRSSSPTRTRSQFGLSWPDRSTSFGRLVFLLFILKSFRSILSWGRAALQEKRRPMERSTSICMHYFPGRSRSTIHFGGLVLLSTRVLTL